MELPWRLRELVFAFDVVLDGDDPLHLRVEVHRDVDAPTHYTVKTQRWDLYELMPRFSKDGHAADEGIFVDILFQPPFPTAFVSPSLEGARQRVIAAIEEKLVELGGRPRSGT
jgi:hypothetical protein